MPAAPLTPSSKVLFRPKGSSGLGIEPACIIGRPAAPQSAPATDRGLCGGVEHARQERGTRTPTRSVNCCATTIVRNPDDAGVSGPAMKAASNSPTGDLWSEQEVWDGGAACREDARRYELGPATAGVGGRCSPEALPLVDEWRATCSPVRHWLLPHLRGNRPLIRLDVQIQHAKC